MVKMELCGKKKLHALSLAEKIQVLEILDESKMSQSEVARRFHVSQPQISRICKNKEKLLADWCSGTANHERKRKRESKYSSIDEALLCWFHIARAKAWDITGPMLLQKAKELADIMGQEFIPSIGWLVRWKRRNNVCFGQRYTSRTNSIIETICDKSLEEKLLQQLKDYSPENIFRCKEFPLLHKKIPNRDQNLAKDSRERICVLLCTNSCGSEKRKPLVVGRYLQRQVFFGIDHDRLPVSYRSSCSGWITLNLFSEWLVNFDRDMGRQHRSVALVVNHDLAHPDMELANVKLVLLPPHDWSISPLNTEIIQNFKSHFKGRLLAKVLSIKNETDCSPLMIVNGLTMLDTIHMIAAAWQKVSPLLVEACCSEAGFYKGEQNYAHQFSAPLPNGMTQVDFCHFVNIEDQISYGRHKGSSMLTEEENVKNDCESLMDCLPTKADALKALGTLRRWFECNGSTEEVFQKFYDCEEEVERLCC